MTMTTTKEKKKSTITRPGRLISALYLVRKEFNRLTNADAREDSKFRSRKGAGLPRRFAFCSLQLILFIAWLVIYGLVSSLSSNGNFNFVTGKPYSVFIFSYPFLGKLLFSGSVHV
ncbi:hypothetical protein BDW68DRAFT_70686 [Aspergillus falconensis]